MEISWWSYGHLHFLGRRDIFCVGRVAFSRDIWRGVGEVMYERWWVGMGWWDGMDSEVVEVDVVR